ncbi:MAG TPA: hypothetical protein PKC10_13055, partial [Cyclobacteriaceae bacterium]|nr:hypothetical protein [Cyclobacteriaceae bacterium]
MKKFLSLLLLGVVVMSCSRQPEQIFNPKLDKLKLLPGFKAEHLYSPGDQNQGSWVAMTFDNKGRMI